MEGVMISLVVDDDSNGVGSFGIMRGDDGRHYVWSASHIFRNYSFPEIGERYRFDVVEYRYATNIDQINKHRVKTDLGTVAVEGTVDVYFRGK